MSSTMDFDAFMKEIATATQPVEPVATQPVETVEPVAAQAQAAQAQAPKRTKLLLVTTHVNQVNGYSKVAHHLLKELSALPWLDLVLFGTQRLQADIGRALPTVRLLDATALEKDKSPAATGFAFAELPAVLQTEKPDIVLFYNDLSVIATYLDALRKVIEHRTFRTWAYVDLTYPYPPAPLLDTLNRDVERLFVFTKGWKEHLKALGATRPIDVLPHAVDPAIYRPIPKDLARQTLGLPKDVFLFTSLNKNIPRKRLDLLVMAFTDLIVRHPTKPLFLLIVADKGDRGGYPLFDIFARELKHHQASVDHFGNRLLVTSKDTCYKDEDINLLYNCGDVGVSCAEAEGFGLCTLEQMSLGIPQIVSDVQGYREYCRPEHATIVPTTTRYYLPQAYQPVTGMAHAVDPKDVATAMETYVFQEDKRKLHAQRGKDVAAAYTWSKAAQCLIKRLQAVREEEDE